MNRRGLMIANALKGGGGYVQDGLYSWLDGIDKGASANTWTDLKGNITYSGSVTSQSTNYVTFNGNSLYTQAINSIMSSAFTIEICYELIALTSSGFVVGWYPPNSSRGGIKEDKFELLGNYSISTALTGVGLNTKQTVSVTYDGSTVKVYLNGTLLSTSTATLVTDNYTVGIACRGSDTRFRTKLNAYSFRLYNKAITADDVLNNYNYDKSRFNI